jgi:hypothetical protein
MDLELHLLLLPVAAVAVALIRFQAVEEELQDGMVVLAEVMLEDWERLVLEVAAAAGQVFIPVRFIIWLQAAEPAVVEVGKVQQIMYLLVEAEYN